MYEIGGFINYGSSAAFFHVRDHPSLGVKINFHETGRIAKERLTIEMNRARVLKELGISVLNYSDVVQMTVPSHIGETLDKVIDLAKNVNEESIFMLKDIKDFFLSMIGRKIWGLVMDYIDDDIVFLHAKKLKTMVSSERVLKVYNKELEKIRFAGITIEDSDSGWNVLWSESRAKLYFIDFDYWLFPDDDNWA